jgi:pyridoxine kinase
VPQPTAEAIRDRLMPLADVVTPNLFELQWLTGRGVSAPEEIVTVAREAPPETVLVTSMHGTAPDRIGNLLGTGNLALLAEHERLAHPPNGAGDLTAALFLGGLLSGRAPAKALEHATGAVRDVLVRAVGRGANELSLATDSDCLRQPEGRISVLSMAPEPAPSK